jgi:hypothetical protein
MPVWGFGCGPTPPDLTSNRPKRAGIELITMATILRALAARPHSVAALAAAAGIDHERVGLLLRQMHGELRMVRIASYKSHRRIPGGVPAAQYMLGFDQPDAVRPAPTPVKVLYARQWAQKVAKRQRREAFERLAANAFVFTLAAGAEA